MIEDYDVHFFALLGKSLTLINGHRVVDDFKFIGNPGESNSGFLSIGNWRFKVQVHKEISVETVSQNSSGTVSRSSCEEMNTNQEDSQPTILLNTGHP